jgi:hypothetical protein
MVPGYVKTLLIFIIIINFYTPEMTVIYHKKKATPSLFKNPWWYFSVLALLAGCTPSRGVASKTIVKQEGGSTQNKPGTGTDDKPAGCRPTFTQASKTTVAPTTVQQGQPGVAFISPKATGIEGQTKIPADTSLHTAAFNGDTTRVKALLKKSGINVNAKGVSLATSLHRAADRGHMEVVQALLKERAIQVNAKDEAGYTPLHRAVCQGHTKVVQVLLKGSRKVSRINVNAQGPLLETPLHRAADQGHMEIVQALLKARGIQVNAKDKDGYTPLRRAKEKGHTAVVKVLQEAIKK